MRLETVPSGPARGRRPTDRLFWAVFPERSIAEEIADLAQRLRIGHELTGKLMQTGRFHVTLQHIGDGFGLPSEVVSMAKAIAMKVEMTSFRVEFDHAFSFRNGAFVLGGGDGIAGLSLLQQRIGVAMTNAGLGRLVDTAYTPHVTLLRDDHLVDEHPISPVAWWVREFLLVHSLLGRTQYKILERFPLQ